MPLITTALVMASASLAELSNRNFQRQSGGDDAGIEANGPKAAEEARMFDLAAPVHDHFESCCTRPVCGFLIHDAFLHPYRFGPDADRRLDDFRHVLRTPEYIYDVNRFRNIFEPR